jgi:hypothetical protein
VLDKSAKRILLIAAIVLIAMPSIAVVTSYQISCADDHKEAKDARADKPFTCHFVFASTEKPIPKIEAGTADNGQNQYQIASLLALPLNVAWRAINDPIAIISAILAVFTYGLWSATVTLARDAKDRAAEQAWEMQNSLRIAGDAAWAASDSARAAQRLVTITSDTARHQLRAYISCRAKVDDLRETDEGFEVTMSVSNNGQTPAHSVQCWGQLQSFGFGEEQSFSYAPKELSVPSFVIHPRERHAFNVGTGSISNETREDIRRGLRVMYLWGEIRYLDAFNDPHTTWFRMLHRVWTDNRGDSLHAWVYTDDGNKAD